MSHARAFIELVLSPEYEGQTDDIITLAAHPSTLDSTEKIVGELDSRQFEKLVRLRPKALLLSMLAHADGDKLETLINTLYRTPSHIGEFVTEASRHPEVAYKVLAGWKLRDFRNLRRLAEAVLGDPKCDEIAREALGYLDEWQPLGSAPGFQNYRVMKRMGVHFEMGKNYHKWEKRVRFPKASFDFWPPRENKSCLSFMRDPSKDRSVVFYQRSVPCIAVGQDDLGWTYYWDVEGKGSFYRVEGEHTQSLVHFFDYIGDKIPEQPAAARQPA